MQSYGLSYEEAEYDGYQRDRNENTDVLWCDSGTVPAVDLCDLYREVLSGREKASDLQKYAGASDRGI